jgi:hypothetical protein
MTLFLQRYLAPLYLLLCLMLGGASAAGHLANGLLQLAALGVIAWLVAAESLPDLPPRARSLLRLAGWATAAVAIQLVPLPPALWSMLPGREVALAGYEQVGVAPPWLPISLWADGTVAALLSLAPPIAMILIVFASSGYGRIYAVYVLIGLAIFSILFGVFQKIQGPDSPFYLYEFTNRGGLVGFFANRNHLSTLLLTALPFLAALAIPPSRKADGESKIGRWMITGCALGLCAVGVIIVRSVGGWMIMLPVLIGCLLIYNRGESRSYSMRAVNIAAVVAVLSVLLAVFAPIRMNDLGDKLSGVGPNERNASISTTLRASLDHLPFGSGGGTFRRVYPLYEDPGNASQEYVSHAHSDYAELLLEYGVLGLALIVMALWWWLTGFREVWGRSDAGALGRAGFVALGAVLLHSVVDYPARTAAVAAVAALAAAMMVAPEPSEAPRAQYRQRRKRQKSERTIFLGAE